MPKFVFVHGANGSGKTTLARLLITCAGGIHSADPLPGIPGSVISYAPRGMAFIGPYRTATGGADSIQPYAIVPQSIEHLMRKGGGYDIFAEGLVTPGVALCERVYKSGMRAGYDCHFILLDVPIDECTQHVLARRHRKGNQKPYDNAHLIKKHRSALNWVRNLKQAKVPAMQMSWSAAVRFCLRTYALTAEHVAWE